MRNKEIKDYINVSVVVDIEWGDTRKEVSLKYCQRMAWEMTKPRLNSYVNSMLRGIKNFDDFN